MFVLTDITFVGALHLDDFGTRLINSIIAANTKATVDPATVTATTSSECRLSNRLQISLGYVVH